MGARLTRSGTIIPSARGNGPAPECRPGIQIADPGGHAVVEIHPRRTHAQLSSTHKLIGSLRLFLTCERRSSVDAWDAASRAHDEAPRTHAATARRPARSDSSPWRPECPTSSGASIKAHCACPSEPRSTPHLQHRAGPAAPGLRARGSAMPHPELRRPGPQKVGTGQGYAMPPPGRSDLDEAADWRSPPW